MEIQKWSKGDPLIPFGTTGIFQMRSEDYHSDPCEKPSLSNSIAKRMVAESPFHGWLMHPRLGKCSEHSKTMDRGKLIHSMILGHDPSEFVVVQADDWRTKYAKEIKKSAVAEGRTPILEHQFAGAGVIAEEVHDDLLKQGVVLSGLSEIVLLWMEEVDGVPVQCRCMQDHLIHEVGQIIDFKTCESARPLAVQRACYEYGYDSQFAAYTSAYEHVFPDMAGRSDFLWAFVEILPEGDGATKKSIVQLYRPDGQLRELGRVRWRRGLRMWANCIKTGHWPTYSDGPAHIGPQEWVLKKELSESRDE